MEGKRFALIGCGGFVAPRHLEAIKETGNVLIGSPDKSGSVRILGKYFPDAHFFTEFERFDRHAEKIRRVGKGIDVVSICSPNYLHDAHIRFAFRIGADAICEKPLAINPWNLAAIEHLESETGKRVFNILQLRHHPSLSKLKEKISLENKKEKYDVELSYITPRGRWYFESWKGDVAKSGGIVVNLGIHFFDMLIWIFGKVEHSEVHYSDRKRASGYLELEKARVRWFLSTDRNDLPKGDSSYRSITINGESLEFSEVFSDLHTEAYRQILAGKGFGINDAKPSIELTYKIRNTPESILNRNQIHRLLLEKNSLVKEKSWSGA